MVRSCQIDVYTTVSLHGKLRVVEVRITEDGSESFWLRAVVILGSGLAQQDIADNH